MGAPAPYWSGRFQGFVLPPFIVDMAGAADGYGLTLNGWGCRELLVNSEPWYLFRTTYEQGGAQTIRVDPANAELRVASDELRVNSKNSS